MNISLQINRNCRQSMTPGIGRRLLRRGLLALGTMILAGFGIVRAEDTHLDFYLQSQDSPFIVKTADLLRLSFGADNTLKLHTGETGNITSVFSASEISRIDFSNSPIGTISAPSIKEGGLLRIYPNPASESICISGMDRADIELLSISGANILKIPGYNGETINISHLPAGVYILRAGNNTTKLIKK